VNDKGRYHTLTDMALEQPFSKRNRYSGRAKEITIREDAPENLRYVVLQTAIDLGWAPSSLRTIHCRVLHVPPDSGNWSEYQCAGSCYWHVADLALSPIVPVE